MLMNEYEQAIKAYRIAKNNFDNATFENMDSAITVLNATEKRLHEIHIKVKKAYMLGGGMCEAACVR